MRAPADNHVIEHRAIPDAFAESIVTSHGATGRDWIATVPTIVADLLQRWELRPGGRLRYGRTALIVPVETRDGSAVLKVSSPRHRVAREAHALRAFSPRCCVRVLSVDDERNALLLERAGQPFRSSERAGDEWIEVAAGIAVELAQPAPSDARALSDTAIGWERQLDEQCAQVPDLVPDRVLERARRTIRRVGQDTSMTLIHGDLHEGNVLAGARRPWLVIDPIGYRGPIAWDAFTVCLPRASDRSAVSDPAAALRARLRRFSHLTQSDDDYAVEVAHARAVSSLLHESTGGPRNVGRELLDELVRTL